MVGVPLVKTGAERSRIVEEIVEHAGILYGVHIGECTAGSLARDHDLPAERLGHGGHGSVAGQIEDGVTG